MKVLMVHNHYQRPGGEDQVFAAESELLEGRGWQVTRHTADNARIQGMGPAGVAAATVWSRAGHRDLLEVIRRVRPDVMHCHNTFPLISPAAYYAARSEGVAVVQTLHNYRIVCPGALLLRDGRPCEDCVGDALPWRSVVHRCYRGSRGASAAAAAMISVHHGLRTWQRKVDRYIALTEFSRRKFIEGGLPAARIVTKPNFLAADPGAGGGRGGYALFVGRLSQEKGIGTLLRAWKQLDGSIPLKIIGDGPLGREVAEAAVSIPGIERLGARPHEAVLEQMGEAAALVLPSACYETFGLVAVEAFAKSTPVVASDLGAMAEIIDDGRTGLLFRPSDPADLADAVRRMFARPAELERMRAACRREFVEKFTAEANFRRLSAIYREAVAERQHGRRDQAHRMARV